MRTYEITYITVGEENAQADIIRPILMEHKAAITSVFNWDGGRRRLIYPIKKQDQGFYTTVVFEADPSDIMGIERDLRHNHDVLRALIVLFEPGVFHRVPDTLRPARREPTKSEAKVAESSVTQEVKAAEEAAQTEVSEEPPAVQEEVAEEKPKRKRTPRKASEEESKALDEKLDELLNEDLTS